MGISILSGCITGLIVGCFTPPNLFDDREHFDHVQFEEEQCVYESVPIKVTKEANF